MNLIRQGHLALYLATCICREWIRFDTFLHMPLRPSQRCWPPASLITATGTCKESLPWLYYIGLVYSVQEFTLPIHGIHLIQLSDEILKHLESSSVLTVFDGFIRIWELKLA